MNRAALMTAPARYVMPFVLFLVLVTLSVFSPRSGLIAIAAIITFTVALLRPKAVFFAMIALLPVTAFDLLGNVSYIRFVGLLLTVCLGLRIAMLHIDIPQDDTYKYFGLFFIGGTLSLFSAVNPPVSIERLFTYLSLFLFYFLGRYFFRQLRDVNISVDVLILSTLSFQFLGVKTHSGLQRISAGVGDPNGYAALLDVLIPLAIYRWVNARGVQRMLYLPVIIALTVLLLLTGSRGGYLGFLGAACVLLYHYGARRILAATVLAVYLAGTVYFAAPDWFWQRAESITASEGKDSSIDLRIDHYRAALQMFLEHPVSGVGLNNFQFNNLEYGDVHSQVVHNSYLEVLTGGGLLCLIPFLMIEWACWRKLSLKHCHEKALCDLLVCLKASFVSLLTTGLFLSADYDKTLWFVFALISSAYYLKRTQQSQRGARVEGTAF